MSRPKFKASPGCRRDSAEIGGQAPVALPSWLGFRHLIGTHVGVGLAGAPSNRGLETRNRLLAGGSRMAGPALGPGTPRFSVVEHKLSNGAPDPANSPTGAQRR